MTSCRVARSQWTAPRIVAAVVWLSLVFSIFPEAFAAATTIPEGVALGSENAPNAESPGAASTFTDISESEAMASQQATGESNEEPITSVPGRLVRESASGAAAARIDSVRVGILPTIINSRQTKIEPDHRTRRIWLGLSIAQHSGAVLDAWTTRRALSQDDAREVNPLLRPFAGNASLYAAIQVGPTIFDLLSRRMMTSKHEWMRRNWWILQAASAAISVGCGAHNLGLHRPH